jgi:hypothetical protein
MLIPGVSAFFFEPLHDIAQSRIIFEALAAALAIKNDDGHAPKTLAGNAPVGTMLDHFVHAVFAPGGKPFHVMNFFESFLAKRFLMAVGSLVHLDEPLLGSAEDHGVVAAPAVGIRVLGFVVTEERATIAEQFHDDGIRGENVLAFVFGQAFEIDAFVVEWSIGFEAIFLSGDKVFGAVARSGVHDAAALIERDVISKDAGNLEGQEGMLEFHALEIAAVERGANVCLLDAALSLKRSNAIRSEQQRAFFRVHNHIGKIGMKR